MPSTNNRLLISVLALVLLLLVFGAMSPLLSQPAEFIGDDYYFVANNPRVTSPGFDSLKEIWLKPMRLEYFPVTITSYAIEHALWGDSVVPYRLTNLLLFWGIGLVSWSLVRRLANADREQSGSLREVFVTFLAVVVTLLHPVNVESAAAISHRKELLYVLFGLLSFRFYATVPRNARTTAAALAFMALAQLSKGTGIILPVLFAVYELCSLRDGRSVAKRVAGVLPFAILSAAVFGFQFLVAFRSGVVASEPVGSLAVRVGGVVRVFNFMITKFFWPSGLTYDYDIAWPTGIPAMELILPSMVLALLVFLGITRRLRQLALVLLVLVPLLPYAQIVPLTHNLKGQMVFYDHYLLFSTVLFSIPLAGMLLWLPERLQNAALGVPVILAAVWVPYDVRLSRFWQTRESLYQRVIAVSPLLPKGYLFLGRSYLEAGRYDEAKATLNRVFTTKQWNPTFAEVYQALGDACAFSGGYADAERNYREYLKYKPDDLKSLQNLSSALIEMRKLEEARKVVNDLLRYYPADPIGKNNLALVVAQQKGTP